MTFGLWKVRIKSGLADNRELQLTIPQISVDRMFPLLKVSSDTEKCEEANLSTIASMDSAMSKYISLFECRIPCLRHGIGAASGAVVGAWILLGQLDQGGVYISCTHPETPATFSSFRIRVGGRTISLSIADSMVIGCPSSSISSTSCSLAPVLSNGGTRLDIPCRRCQSYPSRPSRSHPPNNPVTSPEKTRGTRKRTMG